jgi:hypothetical protein
MLREAYGEDSSKIKQEFMSGITYLRVGWKALMKHNVEIILEQMNTSSSSVISFDGISK